MELRAEYRRVFSKVTVDAGSMRGVLAAHGRVENCLMIVGVSRVFGSVHRYATRFLFAVLWIACKAPGV